MDSGGYYLPKDVQRITGCSASALRNYSRDYARWLSTESTTPPRRFSPEDVRLIAYVLHCTKDRAMTHEQVLATLAAGDLESFEYTPPPIANAPSAVEEPASTALVPLERLQAAQLLLSEAQRREAAAADQVATLQAEVNRLAGELGKARGELAGVKESRYKAPAWWRAVFGGRSGE